MPAPAGFADLMARKYDILQEGASSEANLRNAQANAMASSTPFENALKSAQARQTTEQANTVAPLAKASIASTMAGASEAGARSGLYGAQAGTIRDDLAPLGVLGQLGGRLAYQLSQAQNRQTPNNGLDANGNWQGFHRGVSNVRAHIRHYADGTSDVAAPAGGGVQVSGGGGFGSAQQQGAAPVTGMGQAVLAPPTNRAPGASQMEGSGFGSTTGPGAGATPGAHVLDITGSNHLGAGSYSTDGKIGWASPLAAPAMGVKIDPTTGLPIGGFAKGTSKVPAKGKGKAPSATDSAAVSNLLQALTGAGGAAGAPQAAPQAAPAAAPPGGAPAVAPGGLAGMLAAAMGANQVPGKGPGTVDTVPAMLAPGEAVVNKAAIKHLPGGRKEIAKANAQGNKDVTGRGMAKKVAVNHAPTKNAGKGGHHVAINVKVG